MGDLATRVEHDPVERDVDLAARGTLDAPLALEPDVHQLAHLQLHCDLAEGLAQHLRRGRAHVFGCRHRQCCGQSRQRPCCGPAQREEPQSGWRSAWSGLRVSTRAPAAERERRNTKRRLNNAAASAVCRRRQMLHPQHVPSAPRQPLQRARGESERGRGASRWAAGRGLGSPPRISCAVNVWGNAGNRTERD